jgi:hypothetical protein
MTAARNSPIPLVPNREALTRSERRSFVRACTAMMLGAKQGVHPRALVKSFDDARAELILRAASDPASTTSAAALGLQSTRILAQLAPASASARLLAMATSLDLSGLQSIRLPFIGFAGRPPVPFVVEGDPGSVVDLNVSATVLARRKNCSS